MISKEDKISIGRQWSFLAGSIIRGPLNFQNIKSKVDGLEDLINNTKGIRSDISNAVKIELQNIKDASLRKEVSKVLDSFDNLTTLLQTNLRINFGSYYVLSRSLENLRDRGF